MTHTSPIIKCQCWSSHKISLPKKEKKKMDCKTKVKLIQNRKTNAWLKSRIYKSYHMHINCIDVHMYMEWQVSYVSMYEGLYICTLYVLVRCPVILSLCIISCISVCLCLCCVWALRICVSTDIHGARGSSGAIRCELPECVLSVLTLTRTHTHTHKCTHMEPYMCSNDAPREYRGSYVNIMHTHVHEQK